MNSWLGRIVFLASMLSVLSVAAIAQEGKSRGSMKCNDNWSGKSQESYCEIREQTVPAGGELRWKPAKTAAWQLRGGNETTYW